MQELFINSGTYAAKWGVTDLYEDEDKLLREAIASGEPFTTGWYGAKKEIEYALIVREVAGGPIRVEGRSIMDDGPDLVDTALWRAAGGNDFCVSGWDALDKHGVVDDDAKYQLIDDICEACDLGENNLAEGEVELPATATYDEVMEALDKLIGEADASNTDWFNDTVEYCKLILKGLSKDV